MNHPPKQPETATIQPSLPLELLAAQAAPPHAQPSLTIDWQLYAAYLDESDASDEEKQALIESLFSIILGFVDLGFRLNPLQHGADGDGDALPQIIAEVVRESDRLDAGGAHD
ncbi:hypothetical protein [Jiella pacifica]|uniref:Uncharacterized protein n=1 Tax=Jiella pacifica TaxID=2696469 RepID=A0A6N9T8U8_9HYPH|nr:hypothetical protein [Jiella pacifica]NDW06476.1 hypothetical protein [Jiella pacifica]